MTINQNKVVSVNYHLSSYLENEAPELVEQTSKEQPFTFIFGVGQLIPDFEKNLVNKKVGDKFDFKVTPANGYGVSDKERVKGHFYYDGDAPQQLLVPTPSEKTGPGDVNDVIDWVNYSDNGKTTYYDYPNNIFQNDLNYANTFVNNKTYSANF